jgi:hypothetical protein
MKPPRRRRRRYLNRGTTPLWWADAPAPMVQRIYQEARAAVPQRGGSRGAHSDPVIAKQPWLRRVSEEFHRRLREALVYVEGASDCE